MRKGTCFIIPIKVYAFADVLVSIAQTDDDVIRAITKYVSSEASLQQLSQLANLPSTIEGMTVWTPCNRMVLRIKKYPKTPQEYGTLAHEVFHATTFLMSKIGCKLEMGVSEEAYAYLMEFLTKEILTKISDKSKK